MKGSCSGSVLVSVFLVWFIPVSTWGQPLLPSVRSEVHDGVVQLSWTSQYDGIKSIGVKRSTDSTGNYKSIGELRSPQKGVQQFEDNSPESGSNYYKLNITFTSGLNWTSNTCSVHISSTTAESRGIYSAGLVSDLLPDSQSVAVKPGSIADHVGIRSEQGNVDAIILLDHRQFIRPKVLISYEEVDFDNCSFIIPKHIRIEPETGHVSASIPDDYRTRQYSITFYNMSGSEALVIPQLNASVSIIDYRNFRAKGRYKFVLRKDGVEMEGLFIKI